LRRLRAVVTAATLALAAVLPCRAASAFGDASLFDMPMLAFDAPGWDARPNAVRRLLQEVEMTTSIAVVAAPGTVAPTVDALLGHPIAVWRGDGAFPPLPDETRAALATWLGAGGLLFIDGADPQAGGGFDASIRRELAAILPGRALEAIPRSHVLWKTFYLVDTVPGRLRATEELFGITRDDRLVVVYSNNDVLGTWSRDNFGTWEYEVFAGGDRQRDMTMRFGVNLAMYALCLDYKEDQAHVNYLLRRRRWQPE